MRPSRGRERSRTTSATLVRAHREDVPELLAAAEFADSSFSDHHGASESVSVA
ncbi:hypothetical protein ACGFT2_33575 [Streptomyces sp. NPDC048514]|uniref:hypothetical protein n=1 Tax=Streptomyces sp. NPDC048514 TaxID=3365564 RepID=UPI00371E56C6